SSDTSMKALFSKQSLRNSSKSVVRGGYRHYLTTCSWIPRPRARTDPAGEGLSTHVVGAAPPGGGAAHNVLAAVTRSDLHARPGPSWARAPLLFRTWHLHAIPTTN